MIYAVAYAEVKGSVLDPQPSHFFADRTPTDHALLHIAHHNESYSLLTCIATTLVEVMMSNTNTSTVVLRCRNHRPTVPRAEFPIAIPFPSRGSLPLDIVRILVLFSFLHFFGLRLARRTWQQILNFPKDHVAQLCLESFNGTRMLFISP